MSAAILASCDFDAPAVRPERRQRPRLVSQTAGWLLSDTHGSGDRREAYRVQVRDVCRNGVGFIADRGAVIDATCRIRIGQGPLHLARRIRIAACRELDSGLFAVGCQFIQ